MSTTTHPAVFLKVSGVVRPLAPVKRQRARLWELNDSVHCSIIGTCLTTGELRRVMGKVIREDVAGISDHDLHSQAVGLCSLHTPAAKLLHKALDQRHEIVIKRFGKLQGDESVLNAWSESRKSGDIPGAYWAVLTHPDVGITGIRRAFGDVHMLSHLIGAANRADIRRLTALEDGPWRKFKPFERQNLLLKLADLVDQNFEELAALEGLLRPTDGVRGRQGRHADRTRRNLRPGDLRHPVQDHRRSDRARQQDQLRPRQRLVDQGCYQGASAGARHSSRVENYLLSPTAQAVLASNGFGPATSVREPSNGLLLAFGVAGLALLGTRVGRQQ